MSTLIECKDLNHSYGKKKALEDVSFTIEPGRIIGLFGPNGCGKTTLIKILCGMTRDESSSVNICGKPVGKESKSVVSYSPDRIMYKQDSKITDILDLYEMMYDDFDREKAENIMKELGITPEEQVGKLSKGNAEKLQIILTMSRNARLFILDEPFTGVDPVARESIIRILLQNISEDASVLLSTHQIGDIEQILDDAIFMKEGRIVFHKSVEELRDETGKSLADTYMEEYR